MRPVDPSVASNRFAVLATVVVTLAAAAATLVADEAAAVTDALARGLGSGVGAFLAWALARELHPDRTRAARDAALAYLPATFLGPPALAGVLALLLAARVTVRSTGRRPSAVDLAVLVGVSAVASTSAAGFVAAAVLAWAVVADGHPPDPAPQLPSQLGGAAVAVAALVGSLLSSSFLTGWRRPTVPELVWIVVVIVAVALRPRLRPVTSRADDARSPILTERVLRARRLVAVGAAAALAWAGGDAVPALAPAAAALVGVATTALRQSRPRDAGTAVEPPSGVAT